MSQFPDVETTDASAASSYCHLIETPPLMVTIEYSDAESRLHTRGLSTLKEEYFYMEEEDLLDLTEGVEPYGDDPDAFIEHFYNGLVEVLYPGYANRDEPWRFVPMHVTIDLGSTEISLGGFY